MGATNGHGLQRWLERNEAPLAASGVTTVLGRAPTLATGRGATWISLESKRGLGRIVLFASGRCDLTASVRADGSRGWNKHEQISSSDDLDAALAALVAQLT